jgi:hypothetical protein
LASSYAELSHTPGNLLKFKVVVFCATAHLGVCWDMRGNMIQERKPGLLQRPFHIVLIATALATSVRDVSADNFHSRQKTVRLLGDSLYAALTPRQRESIATHPVQVATNPVPILRLEAVSEQDRRKGILVVSTGFIELIDQIACAEAIEIVKPGYLRKFLSTLDADGQGFKASAEEAILTSYSTEIQNERKTGFNQLMASTLAICLAQHYLGIYDKRLRGQLDEKRDPLPLAMHLSQEEWERSLEAGARNSLANGNSIKSLALLMRCFDAMPRRPKWAGHFLPNSATGLSSSEMMLEIEAQFFSDK